MGPFRESMSGSENLERIQLLSDAMVRSRRWESEPGEDSERSVVYALGEANCHDIEARIERSSKPVVVEIGCGKAKSLSDLADRHPQIIPVGIDLKPQSDDQRILLMAADGATSLKPGSAEIIYSVQTYKYVHDKLKFLSDIFLALKVGGLACIDIDGEYGWTRPILGEIIKHNNLGQYFKIQVGDSDREPHDAALRIEKPEEEPTLWRENLVEARRSGDDGMSVYSFYDTFDRETLKYKE